MYYRLDFVKILLNEMVSNSGDGNKKTKSKKNFDPSDIHRSIVND